MNYISVIINYSYSHLFIWQPARQKKNPYHLSGIRVEYDLSKPVNQRVVSLLMRCTECRVPKFEPLDPQKTYTVVMTSFMVGGGDGYSMIQDELLKHNTGKKQKICSFPSKEIFFFVQLDIWHITARRCLFFHIQITRYHIMYTYVDFWLRYWFPLYMSSLSDPKYSNRRNKLYNLSLWCDEFQLYR